MFKKIIFVVIFAFIVIQFIPVQKTNPPVTRDFQTEKHMKKLLKRSCYDCHSNETVWPWYSRIAPFSWLLADDVSDARKHVNFSEWDKYDPKKVRRIIEEMVEQVEEGEMPLRIYLFMHHEAKLSDADIAYIKSWAAGQDSLETHDLETTE